MEDGDVCPEWQGRAVRPSRDAGWNEAQGYPSARAGMEAMRLLWPSRDGDSGSHRLECSGAHSHVSCWAPRPAAVSDVEGVQGAVCRCWYLL